jgi:AcrR family transcriptional regulator
MRKSDQGLPAERMLRMAAELLQIGGIEAASTRAVAAAADVQPPTIYRQFGDKDGLLDEVARLVLQRYIHQKRLLVGLSEDPWQELRELWDLHVEFGLAEPNSTSSPTAKPGGGGRCRRPPRPSGS